MQTRLLSRANTYLAYYNAATGLAVLLNYCANTETTNPAEHLPDVFVHWLKAFSTPCPNKYLRAASLLADSIRIHNIYSHGVRQDSTIDPAILNSDDIYNHCANLLSTGALLAVEEESAAKRAPGKKY
jgi:hypothetical protein